MIKLYGVSKSRASRNVWVLNELGVPFEQVPVIQTYRLADPSSVPAHLQTTSAEFRAINPDGQIPMLDDDGFRIGQSLAINLYLVKKFGGPLAPKDIQEDARMTGWALWALSEVEPHSLLLMQHRVSFAPALRDAAVAERCREALRKPFGVLDTALRDGGGYLVGRRFTVADANTVEVCRYATVAPDLFEAHPNLKQWFDTARTRPAYQAMWEARSREPD